MLYLGGGGDLPLRQYGYPPPWSFGKVSRNMDNRLSKTEKAKRQGEASEQGQGQKKKVTIPFMKGVSVVVQ